MKLQIERNKHDKEKSWKETENLRNHKEKIVRDHRKGVVQRRQRTILRVVFLMHLWRQTIVLLPFYVFSYGFLQYDVRVFQITCETSIDAELSDLGGKIVQTVRRWAKQIYFIKLHAKIIDFAPLIDLADEPTTVITLREEMNLCSTSH